MVKLLGSEDNNYWVQVFIVHQISGDTSSLLQTPWDDAKVS